MATLKTQTRSMQTVRAHFWHVRFTNAEGESPLSHPGWIVRVQLAAKPGRPRVKKLPKTAEPDEVKISKESYAEAIRRVAALGLDNGPDGEWSRYPELTADILEFNDNDVAELY